MTHLLHTLAMFFGIDNEAGHGYAFFSGTGSDIGELAIIGGMVQFARNANCHSKGCWRFGSHPYEMDGVVHKLCRHCHPVLKGQRHTREVFHARHAEERT